MRDHKNHSLPSLRTMSPDKLIAQAAALPIRGKVIGWLFLFITAYRAGLPVLYSAALAAVPWLLLPPAEKK